MKLTIKLPDGLDLNMTSQYTQYAHGRKISDMWSMSSYEIKQLLLLDGGTSSTKSAAYWLGRLHGVGEYDLTVSYEDLDQERE